MDSQRIRIHGTKVQAGDRRGRVQPSAESSRCGKKVTNNFEHLNFTVISGSKLQALGSRLWVAVFVRDVSARSSRLSPAL
jgi:hypothetical protein